jgi:predicted transcriptional regulator
MEPGPADLPDLNEVRIWRTRLGWSQQKLGRMCGVSQSYVNKVERGEANPGYKSVKRIFEIMKEHYLKADVEKRTASDLMLGNAVSVSTQSTIQEARKLMIRYDYSQLPVIDNGIVKGSITERTLITLDPTTAGKKVGEVMESKFPVVSADTKLETIKHMLADFQAVLVDKGEGQYGITTKHRLLKAARF